VYIWDVCMQFMVLYWNGFMLIDDLGFVFCGTYNDALVGMVQMVIHQVDW